MKMNVFPGVHRDKWGEKQCGCKNNKEGVHILD